MKLTVNGKPMELDDGATIPDLLARLALPGGPVAFYNNINSGRCLCSGIYCPH